MDRQTEKYDSGLEKIIDSRIALINTGMPGQIISFDNATGTAVVQPCLMRKFFDQDEPIEIPPIEDVRCLFPGSSNFWQTFDVKADSYCWLLFSQRSLAVWLDQGGIVDPASKRKHSLSDCVAIVGLWPDPDALSPAIDSDAFVIRNADNTVLIKIEADTITIDRDGTSIVLDDEVAIDNGSGTITLKSSGQVDINGNFTVDP